MATRFPAASILPRDGVCLATPNYPWFDLKSYAAITGTVGGTVTDLTSASSNMYASNILGDPAHIVPGSGKMDLRSYFGSSANGYIIQFYGDDTADQVLGFELYGFRSGSPTGSSPALPIYLCDSTASLGTMLCDSPPTDDADNFPALGSALWVDTISGTACGSFNAAISDSANNRIATLTFDSLGIRYLYLRLFTNSSLTEVLGAGAIISAY